MFISIFSCIIYAGLIHSLLTRFLSLEYLHLFVNVTWRMFPSQKIRAHVVRALLRRERSEAAEGSKDAPWRCWLALGVRESNDHVPNVPNGVFEQRVLGDKKLFSIQYIQNMTIQLL